MADEWWNDLVTAPAEEDDPKQSAKVANLNSLTDQINRVQSLYSLNLAGGPSLSSLAEYLPTPTNTQFNTAGAGLAEQGLAAFRVPGVGSQSDNELRQFVEANKPRASDNDADIEEKLRQLRSRVDATRETMSLPAAKWDVGTSPNDIADFAPPLMQPQTTISPTGGGVSDPNADEGYRTQIATLIQRGASRAEIEAFARGQGRGPDMPGLDEALQFRESNPGYKGSFDVRPEAIERAPSTFGALSASPFGSGVAGSFNALTAGTSDEIVGGLSSLFGGDYGESRDRFNARKKLLAAANPASDFAGNVIGGGVAMAIPGAAALKIAPKIGAGMFGSRALSPGALALDGAYGTAFGAGENNDDRLGGALTGGVAGLAGGALGRGAANGLGSAIAPTGGRLGDLYNAGVRPTIGQRFAEKGPVGRAINFAEQALQSVPIAGSMVARARQIPRDQFERGAFNQALGEIGTTLPKDMPLGTAPHGFAQKSFNDAYDKARSGMSMAVDQQFLTDAADFARELGSGILSEDQTGRVSKLIQNTVGSRLARQGGGLGGDSYKAAVSDLDKAARKLTVSDPAMADALSTYSGILDSAARRSSPPEAVAALDAADRGYSKLVRVEEAASARGGDTGRFSPTQFDRAVQKTSGRVRSKAYLRGDALMGDFAEAGKSLVDTLPNSGTADRLMLGQAVIGAPVAGALGATLGAPALLKAAPAFLPYAPGMNAVLTRAMAPRSSKLLNATGKGVKKLSVPSGMFGAQALIHGNQ